MESEEAAKRERLEREAERRGLAARPRHALRGVRDTRLYRFFGHWQASVRSSDSMGNTRQDGNAARRGKCKPSPPQSRMPLGTQ